MIFGLLFVKVFQRCQSVRTFLNFIENNQRIVRRDFKSGKDSQTFQKAIRVDVLFKQGFQLLVLFKNWSRRLWKTAIARIPASATSCRPDEPPERSEASGFVCLSIHSAAWTQFGLCRFCFRFTFFQRNFTQKKHFSKQKVIVSIFWTCAKNAQVGCF